MKFCQKCGTENIEEAVTCTSCGNAFIVEKKPKKKKKKGKKIFIVLLILVVLFAIFIGSGDDSSTLVIDDNGNVVLNGEVVPEKDFKKACAEVKYEDLARNPDNYKDKKLMFKGEVIQCEQSYGTSYYARVNVTADEYGYYSDTIYVTFDIPEGEDKILEEDIVKLYGVCMGSETYTSIFGESITIPSLDAAYVELVK